MFKRIINAKIFSRFIIRNHVYSIKTTQKCLAFTFDDGPDPETTPHIIDLFKQFKGKATFYFQGNNAEQHPDNVLLAHQNGFGIGNHSYDHPKYTEVGILEMIRQIKKTNQILQKITGAKITTLRPPCNKITQVETLAIKLIFNQPIINCNIAPTDWSGCLNEDNLSDFLVSSAKPGAIICLHDSSSSTLAALKTALPILHSQGYSFLTMDEMKLVGTFSPLRNLKVQNITT